ncbi:copper resistance protein NlpE [Sphingobacterium sp. lm-10]|uniref:copper resistance protein NlpE N-terminal domain-containing protein n=1 Tax=Sphingobacterium sp. lm-10 TaxID=2944904 RepID=UPI0020209F32|nr:copper resistance protein NlpE N-terminal domain-containing protein [Sphingobacterium sp. lm-10]MCL7986784.1 copper resistance protein NlpE [Sphingobacterium sp. lm-10]
MKSLLFMLPLAFAISCTSADKNKAEPNEGPDVNPAIDSLHSATNMLDWPGNYKGTVPGKEKDSTVMEITINRDNTFAVKTTKKGTSESMEDKGEIKWESNETYIILKGSKVDYSFRLGDDEITFIDKAENVSETATPQEYRLVKQHEYATHDKHQRFPTE